MDLSSNLSSSTQTGSSNEFAIVETDPTGQYVRYDEILGEGASKTVYKGFDEVNGTEVAWSKADISDEILTSEKQLRRLHSEANLLKSLKHDNVMRCYHSWVDSKNKTFNMITELLTSGNLRLYRKKHSGLLLDNRAIKNWARQILRGLDYLHSHNPPIVHRDLKCENIFVNGYSGKVKIGDLGLATALQDVTAPSVIGTPEFMAPELYEEEYNQLVDIYSFGMCMLEMVTRELPYSECKNTAQVYKKVLSGIKPAALDKVIDPQVRQFIDKCLAPVSERLSAADLLNDPFLESDGSSPLTCSPPLTDSVCSGSEKSISPPPVEVVKDAVTKMNIFKLQGKIKDRDSLSMSFWIADLNGRGHRADFVFFLQTDKVVSVTEEMVEQLELPREDVPLIVDLMEELITELVPDFRCSLVEAKVSSQDSTTVCKDELTVQNMPAKEPACEDQDAKSQYVGLSGKDPDSSMQVENDTDSQFRDSDPTHINARKDDSKLGKGVAHKKLSTWLRNLFFTCRKDF